MKYSRTRANILLMGVKFFLPPAPAHSDKGGLSVDHHGYRDSYLTLSLTMLQLLVPPSPLSGISSLHISKAARNAKGWPGKTQPHNSVSIHSPLLKLLCTVFASA